MPLASALLQIPTVEDKQIIAAPDGMNINWVINGDLSKNALLEQIESVSWLVELQQSLSQHESAQMKALNQHLKTQSDYKKAHTYTSGYWKMKA